MKTIAYIITKAIEAHDWSYMEDEEYTIAADALGIEPFSAAAYGDCGSFWEAAITAASDKSISMKLSADEREELDEELGKNLD